MESYMTCTLENFESLADHLGLSGYDRIIARHHVLKYGRIWFDALNRPIDDYDLVEDLERKIVCPVCGKEFVRCDMIFTTDCYGIPFRLVCYDCYEEIMEERGYDGERYYDGIDECVDYDY